MKRPAGDVFEDGEDVPLSSTGSFSTLNKDGAVRRPPREFPPGFHVAAPGPSHDDDKPPRAPRRRRA